MRCSVCAFTVLIGSGVQLCFPKIKAHGPIRRLARTCRPVNKRILEAALPVKGSSVRHHLSHVASNWAFNHIGKTFHQLAYAYQKILALGVVNATQNDFIGNVRSTLNVTGVVGITWLWRSVMSHKIESMLIRWWRFETITYIDKYTDRNQVESLWNRDIIQHGPNNLEIEHYIDTPRWRAASDGKHCSQSSIIGGCDWHVPSIDGRRLWPLRFAMWFNGWLILTWRKSRAWMARKRCRNNWRRSIILEEEVCC